MKKTEVYSWRVTPAAKAAIENAARREGTTISALLDRITKEWIQERRGHLDEEAEQKRLQDEVRKTIGTISGGGRTRAESAGATVRARLKYRYGR